MKKHPPLTLRSCRACQKVVGSSFLLPARSLVNAAFSIYCQSGSVMAASEALSSYSSGFC